MRLCHRCQVEMKEGFDIKLENDLCGITVTESKKALAKRIERPKVAICPKCGEVSLYIENLARVEGR